MTEPNLQQDLSACRDGELPSDATRFLLRRLDHDAELVESWSRYQLIGASLRREQGRLASADFASRVMQAVEAEPLATRSPLSGGRRWLQWSIGGAIAASVAVAALVTSQPGGPDTASPQVAQVLPRTAALDTRQSDAHVVIPSQLLLLCAELADEIKGKGLLLIAGGMTPNDNSLEDVKKNSVINGYKTNEYLIFKDDQDVFNSKNHWSFDMI